MNAIVNLADRAAGIDRSVISAEAGECAGLRSSRVDDRAVGEENRVVGVIVAGRVRRGGGYVPRVDLLHQLGLDSGVVNRVGMVRRRDSYLHRERAAADGLVGPFAAAVVDDVGVVLCQPIDVGAVQHFFIKGGHTRRGRVEDLRKEFTVATARAASPPQHLDHLQVGDDPAAVVSEVSAACWRCVDGTDPPDWQRVGTSDKQRIAIGARRRRGKHQYRQQDYRAAQRREPSVLSRRPRSAHPRVPHYGISGLSKIRF
jgi:hypothetical protein